MPMQGEKSRPYRAYLLRCLAEGEAVPGKAEEILPFDPSAGSGQRKLRTLHERRRKGFSSLGALIAFLRAELARGQEESSDDEIQEDTEGCPEVWSVNFKRRDKMRRKRFWIMAPVLALVLALVLAQPTYADDITVDTTNDVLDAASGICNDVTIDLLPGTDGVTSLREAICAANNNSGPDTILFNITSGCGAGGVCTIQPTNALPFLTDNGTTINGYSQPGTAEATDGTPATLLIEISGANVANQNGFNIFSADNIIKGLGW
jgi:hypothetical protein